MSNSPSQIWQAGLSLEVKIDAWESYANLLTHTGPYAGVTISADYCRIRGLSSDDEEDSRSDEKDYEE